jgi:hypothetical protein
VLRRGDDGAGAVIIQAAEKGRFSGLWERFPDAREGRKWQRVGPQRIDNIEESAAYLERRSRADRDLWLIELDIANVERFIADSAPTG